MGCRILASIGLFVGLLLAWSGVVNTGNLVFGIVLMAICAIPWVTWANKRSKGFQTFGVGQTPVVAPPPAQSDVSTTVTAVSEGKPTETDSTTTVKPTHTRLGVERKTGDPVDVADSDRYLGMYVLGTWGTGKSSLLESLIYQDVQKGYPVIVIDPHGDLVEHVIAQIPERRLKDTYLLEMEDEAYPFGVNVFTGKGTGSIAQTQAVDRVMHIFDVLWGDVLSQQNLPRYLRAATITLLANPGTTLVDMYDFLIMDDLRRKMLKNVTDPTVKQFWEYQYDNKPASARMREVSSLINRLEALFMGRGIVRNIVGQSKTSVDFRQSIENREIILIKLPLKTLPQDASLIGTMLVAQLHAALFSFADTRLEDRPGFSLYVDEFQHFATADFSEMFTEGRKFGSRVCLAHQMRSQIPDALRTLQSATLDTNTIICFKTIADAATMTYVYPVAETVDPSTMPRSPIDYLLQNSCPEEGVEEFTRLVASAEETWKDRLRLIQIKHKPSYIEMDEFLKRNDWPDARYVLDEMLYECMKNGRSDYPIPPKAAHALMFINGLDEGVKSLVDFNPAGSQGILYVALPPSKFAASTQFQQLCAIPTFEALVTAVESVEASMSEDKRDAFENSMDVLVDLRYTMEALAHEPLGERYTTSKQEIITEIQNLRPREAFVKIGDRRSTLRTLDTPTPVSERQQQARRQTILAQTRVKYCTPKHQVEQGIAQRHKSTGGVFSSERPGATERRAEPTEDEQRASRWQET